MKITLLGDSIRLIGYGPLVPGLLGDGFEVFQPGDNCRFAKYTLRMLFELAGNMKGSRVVHWNNGLWDVCDILGDGRPFTSIPEYTENILRIADILLARYDKVIFATTTPVTAQNPHNKNEVIAAYNDFITPLLRERGVIINDLYTPMVEDIPRFIRSDDNIHLTDVGARVCAELVAEAIRKAAEELA